MTRSDVRVAFAKHWASERAAKLCSHDLREGPADVLLVFCGGKHDPRAVLRSFRDAYPAARIVGGSAAGVIARTGFGYTGLEIGAAAFRGRRAAPQVVVETGLDRGEEAAGRRLGERIAALAAPEAAVFLFYDSVAAEAPLRLHPAAALVAGVRAGLGAGRVRLVGGGLLTDLNLGGGWVFDGESVRKHAAIALVFPPDLVLETWVAHGCRPVSAFMTITRIEGAEVLELDGRPALDVLETMLGLTIGGGTGRELSLIATLGEKHGDPYAPFDENAYVNRLILHGDRARGSLTLFEPDFAPGARVQIMSRDNALMLDSTRGAVEAANRVAAAHPGRVALGLYIDCAGRASMRSGAAPEEAEVVRHGLARAAPLLGFYSGVEIAPFGDDARPLDWTGVLALLRYRA